MRAQRKGRTDRSARPQPRTGSPLHSGAWKNGSEDYSESPDAAHLLALANMLRWLARRKTPVLSVLYSPGQPALVVIRLGAVALALPNPCCTAIAGRGDGVTERWEALRDGVRIGWEVSPKQRRPLTH